MANVTQYFPTLDKLDSHVHDIPKVSVTQHPEPMIGMGFGFMAGQPVPFTVGAGSPTTQVPIRLQFSPDYHPVMRSISELLSQIESYFYGYDASLVIENIQKWLRVHSGSTDKYFEEFVPIVDDVLVDWEKCAYVNASETERTLRRLQVNINELLPDIVQPVVGRESGEILIENQIFDQQIRNLTERIVETRSLVASNNYLCANQPELKDRVVSVFDSIESGLRDLIAANDLSNDPVPFYKIDKIVKWFGNEWNDFNDSLREFLPKKRIHELIIKGGLMAALLMVGTQVLPFFGINPAVGGMSTVALFIGGEIKYSELIKRLMANDIDKSSNHEE